MNVSLRKIGIWFLGGCLTLLVTAYRQQAIAQTAGKTATAQRAAASGTTARQPVRTVPAEEAHPIHRRNVRLAEYYEARRRMTRPSFFGFGGGPSRAMGFSPRHQQVVGTSAIVEESPEEISGEIIHQGSPQEVIPSPHGHSHGHVHGDAGCTSCGSAPGHPHQRGCLVPCPWLNLDNLQVFGGVQGYKSPANRSLDGSFGFYEGINYTMPLPCIQWSDVSMQIGARATQSNLSGASFTGDKREQYFFTAGVYRRVDWGLQWGVVFDYLHDEWDVAFDVSQVRGELSWVYPCGDELGFTFTVSGRDVDINLPTVGPVTLETTDVYAFFYRHQFEGCGEGRIFAGFSGQSDGIIGGDVLLPLSDRWSFQGGFTYLIPDEPTGVGGGVGTGAFGESWNVSVGLVWYPGRCRSACDNRYSRPLLNVADNGSLLINNR